MSLEGLDTKTTSKPEETMPPDGINIKTTSKLEETVPPDGVATKMTSKLEETMTPDGVDIEMTSKLEKIMPVDGVDIEMTSKLEETMPVDGVKIQMTTKIEETMPPDGINVQMTTKIEETVPPEDIFESEGSEEELSIRKEKLQKIKYWIKDVNRHRNNIPEDKVDFFDGKVCTFGSDSLGGDTKETYDSDRLKDNDDNFKDSDGNHRSFCFTWGGETKEEPNSDDSESEDRTENKIDKIPAYKFFWYFYLKRIERKQVSMYETTEHPGKQVYKRKQLIEKIMMACDFGPTFDTFCFSFPRPIASENEFKKSVKNVVDLLGQCKNGLYESPTTNFPSKSSREMARKLVKKIRMKVQLKDKKNNNQSLNKLAELDKNDNIQMSKEKKCSNVDNNDNNTITWWNFTEVGANVSNKPEAERKRKLEEDQSDDTYGKSSRKRRRYETVHQLTGRPGQGGTEDQSDNQNWKSRRKRKKYLTVEMSTSRSGQEDSGDQSNDQYWESTRNKTIDQKSKRSGDKLITKEIQDMSGTILITTKVKKKLLGKRDQYCRRKKKRNNISRALRKSMERKNQSKDGIDWVETEEDCSEYDDMEFEDRFYDTPGQEIVDAILSKTFPHSILFMVSDGTTNILPSWCGQIQARVDPVDQILSIVIYDYIPYYSEDVRQDILNRKLSTKVMKTLRREVEKFECCRQLRMDIRLKDLKQVFVVQKNNHEAIIYSRLIPSAKFYQRFVNVTAMCRNKWTERQPFLPFKGSCFTEYSQEYMLVLGGQISEMSDIVSQIMECNYEQRICLNPSKHSMVELIAKVKESEGKKDYSNRHKVDKIETVEVACKYRQKLLKALNSHEFIPNKVYTRMWKKVKINALPSEPCNYIDLDFDPCFIDYINFNCSNVEHLDKHLKSKLKAEAYGPHVINHLNLKHPEHYELNELTVAEYLKAKKGDGYDGIFYSFCRSALEQKDFTWHCKVCRRCMDWRYWHCPVCDRCTYGAPNWKCQHCGFRRDKNIFIIQPNSYYKQKFWSNQEKPNKVKPEWNIKLCMADIPNWTKEVEVNEEKEGELKLEDYLHRDDLGFVNLWNLAFCLKRRGPRKFINRFYSERFSGQIYVNVLHSLSC